MSTHYQVVKVYRLFNPETEIFTDVLAGVLFFQDIWLRLTGPQRLALHGDRRATPATLAKLREHQLVDDAGRTTLLGEAVLHYRPRPADDS